MAIPPESVGAVAAFAGGLAGGWIAGNRRVKRTMDKLRRSMQRIAHAAVRMAIEDHEYRLHNLPKPTPPLSMFKDDDE
jgi:hypothetical protein